LLLNRLTETKDVSVGMPHVHFAHVPRHIGGRPRYFQTLRKAAFVQGIYVVYPNGHPHAFVGGFIALRSEGHRVLASATPTLRIQTQKNFARTGSRRAAELG
jgi:hypothetical protein